MTVPARNSPRISPWRHVGVLGLSLLAGCTSAGLDPDALEFANIWPGNTVPKSSPGAFIRAYDKYCVNGPRDRDRADALLRNANYVRTSQQARNGVRVYAVDNNRPLVALSQNMCLIEAYSRTGQTVKFGDYVARTFPGATPMTPSKLGRTIEQAWLVPGNPAAIVATKRDLEPGNHSRYALIYYQPPGTTKR